ncbi:MAG TPA: hypothetical protein H9671_03540 [Firmicutes bacterium]|nr:hypothetical protein [Bacillota bacterium]
MNLIPCSEDCAHQKEGYCRLSTADAPSPVPIDGCCYFTPAGSKTQTMPAKKSSEKN